MQRRIFRTIGALALAGGWAWVPVGRLLGSSDGLVWMLAALGLFAGASLEWLGQHLLQRQMTRHALTGSGWAVSALVLALIFRDDMAGPTAVGNVALIVACAGSLAWELRLLLPATGEESRADAKSRVLQVAIKRVTRAGMVKPAPRTIGLVRTTAASSLMPPSVRLASARTAPSTKDKKVG